MQKSTLLVSIALAWLVSPVELAAQRLCPVDINITASDYCGDNPSNADCCVCPHGSVIHGLPAGYRICRPTPSEPTKTGLPLCSATASDMCITPVSGHSRLSGNGGSSTLHCDVDNNARVDSKSDVADPSVCISQCNDNPRCTGFNYSARFKSCDFFDYRTAADQTKVPCFTKGTNARPHWDLQYYFNESRLQ